MIPSLVLAAVFLIIVQQNAVQCQAPQVNYVPYVPATPNSDGDTLTGRSNAICANAIRLASVTIFGVRSPLASAHVQGVQHIQTVYCSPDATGLVSWSTRLGLHDLTADRMCTDVIVTTREATVSSPEQSLLVSKGSCEDAEDFDLLTMQLMQQPPSIEGGQTVDRITDRLCQHVAKQSAAALTNSDHFNFLKSCKAKRSGDGNEMSFKMSFMMLHHECKDLLVKVKSVNRQEFLSIITPTACVPLHSDAANGH